MERISIHSAIASGDIGGALYVDFSSISIHSAIASGDLNIDSSRTSTFYFNPLRHR